MPERKRFFSMDLFPYTEKHPSVETLFSLPSSLPLETFSKVVVLYLSRDTGRRFNVSPKTVTNVFLGIVPPPSAALTSSSYSYLFLLRVGQFRIEIERVKFCA